MDDRISPFIERTMRQEQITGLTNHRGFKILATQLIDLLRLL
jgi:hypothetical protein